MRMKRKTIALFADGNNLYWRYGDHYREHQLYPVLELVLSKIRERGEILEKWFYLDDDNPRVLKYARSLGFKIQSKGKVADDVIKEDIAVYYSRTNKAKSGTVFFRYNPVVVKFLRGWIERCKREPKVFDQQHLEGALNRDYFNNHNISLFFLPHSYYQIFDLHKTWGKPVISQMQASRQKRDDR